MKIFNPEKVINSQLKFTFMLFWVATLILLILHSNPTSELTFHPWLSGVIDVTVDLTFSWILFFRILFIMGSTLLAWFISTRHLNIPRKDYTIFFVLPLIHFIVNDWNLGLIVAVYWTIFLLIIHLLFPEESVQPNFRKTLTAAFCCGLLLMNGAFALLFFLIGILIMIICQSISFRRVIIWLLGFLLPSFFVFFYYFLTDQTAIILENSGAFILKEQMLQFEFPLIFYGCPALLFLLIVFVHSRMSENKISVRRSFSALLFSLIALSPAMLTSLYNINLLFAIFGLGTTFYWIKSIYNTRRKVPFIILWLISILFPLLYDYLLNAT